MAAQKFANNASSLLAASITDTDLSVQVDAGFGALFPSPGAGEYFVIALENAAGDVEICKVTARTTDLLTVVRGWEDTVAQAWTNGVTRVELRNTAGSMRQMIQRSGDTMEGNLNLDGNEIQNAVLTGETIIQAGAVIMGATITNAAGDMCNALEIPTGCEPPTVGGSPILTVQSFDPQSVFTAGMIMMWYGAVGDIPDGWALCDGNNGRPDLRNRFIVGVGSDYVVGDVGGEDLYTGLDTTASGAVGATTTGSHVLTIEELPAHNHDVGYRGSNASTTGGDTDFVTDIDSPAKVGTVNSESVGGGVGHTHSTDPIPAHGHEVTFDNRPPYFALYFIIKVDPAGDYGGVGGGGGVSSSMYDMYNEDGCTSYIGGQATLMDDLAIAASQVQINCCASNVFRLVLTENITMRAPNNPISGQVINIIIRQGGIGAYTISWNSVFKWPSGAAPVLSAAVGATDMVTCQYDSSTGYWFCTSLAAFA